MLKFHVIITLYQALCHVAAMDVTVNFPWNCPQHALLKL